MRPSDLDEVMAIAAAVHAGFFERREVFAERLALYPQGCWLAAPADEGRSGARHSMKAAACGYAFMHPARLGHPPALDQLLHRLDPDADCLYLHDIALLPAARGAGLGRGLIELLAALMAREAHAQAALVAVHGSAPYWRSRGFHAYEAVTPDLRDKLASYSDEALYLVRRN
jgi:GNAT superfamily N-acetyltransferase